MKKFRIVRPGSPKTINEKPKSPQNEPDSAEELTPQEKLKELIGKDPDFVKVFVEFEVKLWSVLTSMENFRVKRRTFRINWSKHQAVRDLENVRAFKQEIKKQFTAFRQRIWQEALLSDGIEERLKLVGYQIISFTWTINSLCNKIRTKKWFLDQLSQMHQAGIARYIRMGKSVTVRDLQAREIAELYDQWCDVERELALIKNKVWSCQQPLRLTNQRVAWLIRNNSA